MDIEEREHVTAAWIARQAGVGRAAVANWRKRYPDFPSPVAGGSTTPLFSWPDVRRWLVDTGKGEQLAAAGHTDTGTQQIGDAGADRSLTGLAPREMLARVLVALLPRLGDDDPPADDADPPVVLDPACDDPAVLTAVAERFADHVRLAGQSAGAVDGLPADVDLRRGDALRHDRFGDRRGSARAVVCVPPAVMRTWPAAELAADPRWRFGLPESGDPELAWVQHCIAHLRPRGVAVVVVPPVVAVRQSGRQVRAALVRAGVLREVIALPATSGAEQVWVLQRDLDARAVLMIDLTTIADAADVPSNDSEWDELRRSEDRTVVRAVPQVELLDGETVLMPARYLDVRDATTAAELGGLTTRLRTLYADLGRALPEPVAQAGPVRHQLVALAELERTRAITILPRDATPRTGDLLFRMLGKDPVIATGTSDDERGVAQVVSIDPDRLDPHFVAAFVRADVRAAPVANTHGALTRDDVRRCRIPRLPIVEQRRYGDALRHLLDLQEATARLAATTDAVITQTVHGLTVGALAPHPVPVRESITSETHTNGKTTQ